VSAAITIDVRGLDRLQRRLDTVASPDRTELMQILAAALESQTRRRIASDKRAPDGSAWPDWTTRHARTRKSGQSLLQGEGDLLDSITSEGSADEALVGSNLRYAAIHQFGGRSGMPPGPAAIPPRPYLGLSDDDTEELTGLAESWLLQRLGGRSA